MSATILGAVTLRPGERVIRHFGASLVVPALTSILIAALFLGLYSFAPHSWFLVGTAFTLFIGGVQAIIRLQYQWVITNQRIIQVNGIWTKHTVSITGSRVTDTKYIAPFLSHVFGTGELRVSTAGNDGYQLVIFAQHNPRFINRLVGDLMHENFS